MAHLVDPDEAYEEARDNKAGFNDWPQDVSDAVIYPETITDLLFDEAVEEEEK